MKKFLALALLLIATMTTPALVSAKPLSCDSELQTFSNEGATVRLSARYVYKLPDGAEADKNVLDSGVEAYIDGTLEAVTQLRNEPSSSGGVGGAYPQGSLWLVTGAPQCVEEPQFNGAVTIYVPVELDSNGNTGWLVESRNWKNIDLHDLTINAPSETLKRLSVYFLEPQIVNPHIQLGSLDFAIPEPEPACAFGGISHVQIGGAAKRVTTTEQNTGVETPANFEYDYGPYFGSGMPLFDSAFVPNSYDHVDTDTWYQFMYHDMKADSAHAAAPGPVKSTSEIQILDGPVCSRVYYESVLESVDHVPLFFYHTLAIMTWYRVRVAQDGQEYEGWFPENIRWVYLGLRPSDFTIFPYFDFTAYFLSPAASNDSEQAYFDTWDLIGDRELGESGAQKLASLSGFTRLAPPADACGLSLPTRLNGAPRARVIASALNLRAAPSTGAEALLGLGQNSILALNGLSLCADGFRWSGVSVSGGTLGTRIVEGWAAEHDNAVYYLEPVADAGSSEYVARPTAVPPTATPLPLVIATQVPPTAVPPKPTATPTDPTPG